MKDSQKIRVERVMMKDGLSLAVEENSPQDNPLGWVLLVHGFAGNRSENGLFDAMAESFVKNGFVVLRYDWRGIGESEGAFANTPLATHVEDLIVLHKWIVTRYETIPSSAVGFSLGAALLGLAHPLSFDRLVYLSPAVRPNLSMWPRYESLWAATATSPVLKEGASIYLGRPILESLRDTDLGEKAFDRDVPLLVCHGTGDTRVSHEFSQRAFEQASEHRALRFETFEGASHTFVQVKCIGNGYSQVFVSGLIQRERISKKQRNKFEIKNAQPCGGRVVDSTWANQQSLSSRKSFLISSVVVPSSAGTCMGPIISSSGLSSVSRTRQNRTGVMRPEAMSALTNSSLMRDVAQPHSSRERRASLGWHLSMSSWSFQSSSLSEAKRARSSSLRDEEVFEVSVVT